MPALDQCTLRKAFSVLRHRFAAAALSLSLLTLAACGDDAAKGLDNVDITAKAGEAPKVKWQGKLEPTEVETEVLVKGDGDKTEVGDSVRVHYWFGNGFTEEEAETSYGQSDPLALELNKELTPALKAAFIGHPVGSVVAVASPAKEAFGEQGNPGLGFGDGDSVLIIAEIVEEIPADEVKAMKKQQEDQAKQQAKDAAALEKAKKKALKSAKGTKVDPAAWAPKVTFKKGEVPAIDFKGAPKPSGKLQVTSLIEGQGKKIKKGDRVIVHYVGQVNGAEQPFDSSYSRGDSSDFVLEFPGMVEGFVEGLDGQRIGSRVIIQIPPELGYKDQGGQPAAGIKADDTLLFVVDVLGKV